MIWLLTVGRCFAVIQMDLPIEMASLVSWSNAVVICLAHFNFSTSWFFYYFSLYLYLAQSLYLSLMDFHSDPYRVWIDLRTLYCLCSKKELNIETNLSIVNINRFYELLARWTSHSWVLYFKTRHKKKRESFWRKVGRKIVHKIKDVLPSYMPRN